MSVPDELRRYVPRTDLYDSYDLIHYHMPVEQPPATASYIIFKKGNKTYAKNGVYGHIEYENTDPATVIQNCINALENGGKIFITRGTYEISERIDLTNAKAIVIEGESWAKNIGYGTELKLADGANTQIFYRSPSSYDFACITIKNMILNGNKANQTSDVDVIYAYNSFRLKLESLYIADAKQHAIYLNFCDESYLRHIEIDGAGGAGIYLRGTSGNTLERILIGGCDSAGVYIRAPSTKNDLINVKAYSNAYGLYLYSEVKDTAIIGGAFWNNDAEGILINHNCHGTMIQGCEIKNNGKYATTGYGIRITDAGTACTGNIIMGCRIFDDQDTKTQDYGIYEEELSDYNIIIGNDCRNNATSGISTVGTNTIVANNAT